MPSVQTAVCGGPCLLTALPTDCALRCDCCVPSVVTAVCLTGSRSWASPSPCWPLRCGRWWPWSSRSDSAAPPTACEYGTVNGGSTFRRDLVLVVARPPDGVTLCVPRTVCQGRRHGFSSGGTNRRQVANLHPKYPKNRKIHRIRATSCSNLEGTSPPKFWGTRPLPPPPPLSTPMQCAHYAFQSDS